MSTATLVQGESFQALLTIHLRGLFLYSCVPDGVTIMQKKQRIILAVAILAADLVVFFLPLAAIFLAYVLVFNPPWFRDFINNLDDSA
jgi:hypothetical protein